MGRIEKEVTKEEKVTLLRKIISILDRNKIEYIVYYGTLLGIIRENDFIDNDSDIDIKVFDLSKVIGLKKEFEEVNLEIGYPKNRNFIQLIDKDFHGTDFNASILSFERRNDKLYVHVGVENPDIFYKMSDTLCHILEGKKHKQGKIPSYIMRILISMSKLVPYRIRCHLETRLIDLRVKHKKEVLARVPDIIIKRIRFCGLSVCIPENSEEHLEALYGPKWRIPSNKCNTAQTVRQNTELIPI